MAVDDVTFDVADGDFLVLVGPSGCGKTTLPRMIAGLEDVTSGRVSIGGRDVTRAGAPRPRRRDGLPELRPLSAHDRAREPRLRPQGAADGAGRDPARVEKVARMLQLEPLLDRRPAALSGGQRRRASVAALPVPPRSIR